MLETHVGVHSSARVLRLMGAVVLGLHWSANMPNGQVGVRLRVERGAVAGIVR